MTWVRGRLDFTYAMTMELDDSGFHHSVLAGFHDRPADGDRADRLLGLALVRLKKAGPVREHTTQRTARPRSGPTARTATPAATRRHVRDRVRAVAHLLTAEEGTRHQPTVRKQQT
ncbi:hypothetical protein [Streptomyces daliensis]